MYKVLCLVNIILKNLYKTLKILTFYHSTQRSYIFPGVVLFNQFGEPVSIEKCSAQKMKFSIKDFFSKCDQIRYKKNCLLSQLWEIWINVRSTTSLRPVSWNLNWFSGGTCQDDFVCEILQKQSPGVFCKKCCS